MSATRPDRSIPVLAGLFFRSGCLTFGGGSVTTARVHQELVGQRGLLDQSAFQLCYGLSRITPGTNSLALCVGAGLCVLGWRGAAVALLSVSLPSAAIVVLLTYAYDVWSNSALLVVAMKGVLAASVGIVAASAWALARPLFVDGRRARVSLFVIAAIVLNAWFSISPLQVLALAALVGMLMPGRQNV